MKKAREKTGVLLCYIGLSGCIFSVVVMSFFKSHIQNLFVGTDYLGLQMCLFSFSILALGIGLFVDPSSGIRRWTPAVDERFSHGMAVLLGLALIFTGIFLIFMFLPLAFYKAI